MDVISTILSTAVSVAVNTTYGNVYEAVGSYKFNQYMSQHEACKKAENSAKRLIINHAYGSKVMTDEEQMCVEINNEKTCSYRNDTFEQSRGEIKSVLDRKEVVKDWTCYVQVKATVKEAAGKTDPTFDAQVQIDKPVIRNGDSFNISIQSNAQGYVQIFHAKEDRLVKIFPNDYDRMWLIKDTMTLPRNGYRFRVNHNAVSDVSNESIVVIVTETPINLLPEYSLTKFNSTMDSYSGKKIFLKKGITILRSTS
jgi:Domain of unknown function (DUF4384)